MCKLIGPHFAFYQVVLYAFADFIAVQMQLKKIVRLNNCAQLVNCLTLSRNDSIAMTKLILVPAPPLGMIFTPRR